MSTTKKSPTDLDAVSDHPAFAMFANRRNGLNRSLEAVEGVMGSGCDQFETLVVFIATNLASSHANLLLWRSVQDVVGFEVVALGALTPMNKRGVRADNARIEWAELMQFKRSFTDPVSKGRSQSLANAGIVAFHGRATFVNPTSVKVGQDVLYARHIAVATGAMPRKTGIAEEQYITTSEQLLEMETLPQHIVFIGGDTSLSSSPTLPHGQVRRSRFCTGASAP